jgi:hypothetical protein
MIQHVTPLQLTCTIVRKSMNVKYRVASVDEVSKGLTPPSTTKSRGSPALARAQEEQALGRCMEFSLGSLSSAGRQRDILPINCVSMSGLQRASLRLLVADWPFSLASLYRDTVLLK